MSDPIISLPLAKDWISKLTGELKRLTTARRQKLDELFFEFGDWRQLEEFYIEPDCQLANPADFDERDPIPSWAHRAPLRDWLNRFLKKRFSNRNGHNTLFLLADAGMGKSSLLTMLKLTEIQRFWPRELEFQLLKLGPDTLESLKALRPKASRTVLLLDALDEDRSAWGKVGDRIEELLHEATAFRHAILTCRTQYFPSIHDGMEPNQPRVEPGKFRLRGFECNLLYLSPFDQDQIGHYLERAYPDSIAQRISRWLSRSPDRRNSIRGVVESMGDLSMRPLLLAYLEDLVDRDCGPGSEYAIYERLVDRWLAREVRKLAKSGVRVSEHQLWSACVDLALELQRLGQRSIRQSRLDGVLGEATLKSALQAFNFGGRSLLNRNGQGEYRFAHYSVQEFLVIRAIIQGRSLPDGTLRVTTQMLVFLVSATSGETKALPEIPWLQLDLSEVEIDQIDLQRLSPSSFEKIRRSLSRREDEQQGECYLRVREEVAHPFEALLVLDRLRRQTRNGDDLYHLDLAAHLIGQAHPEYREVAQATRAKFYNHIPAPSAGLFEKVKTADGVVDLWCEIPVGEYQLGSPNSEHAQEGERTPYRVSQGKLIKIAAVPVTQAQYRAFDSSHESHFKGDDRPVEQVSWWAAVAFCRWLASHSTTAGARLPTEEEWEIACRAGTTTRYWSGDKEPDLARVGWYKENSGQATHPAGLKPANQWGLCDVHGNVWEWTASQWFDPNNSVPRVTSESPKRTKKPGETADSPAISSGARRARRVIRGGGYWSGAQGARSAFMDKGDPGTRDWDLGFRVLLPLASQ